MGLICISVTHVEMCIRVRKAFVDTEENTIQMMYVISHFFGGECEVDQFLTYMMQMWTENFFMIYMLWYCIIENRK